MSGLVVIAIGVVLCFFGIFSLHLAVAASGFGLAWTLANNFDATAGTALLIGLGGAAAAWIIVSVVLRAAGFFVGAIAGAVVGSKIYTLLQGDDSNAILAVIFVLAMAALGGFLTNRFRRRFVLWLCALGGAGIILSGLAIVAPSLEEWVADPSTSFEAAVSTVLWLALAVLGVIIQRRLFPRQLGVDDDP